MPDTPATLQPPRRGGGTTNLPGPTTTALNRAKPGWQLWSETAAGSATAPKMSFLATSASSSPPFKQLRNVTDFPVCQETRKENDRQCP